MLDIPPESIKEITISNPELPPETVASKFSRLDLSLNVDNKLVNVEIQVKTDTDYRDRTLFFGTQRSQVRILSSRPEEFYDRLPYKETKEK